MRKKLDTTGNVFPMPVLMVATYNEDGSVDVMNAAWGTMQERKQIMLAWFPATKNRTSLQRAA